MEEVKNEVAVLAAITSKAMSIADMVRDGWYKQSREVESFDMSLQKLQLLETILAMETHETLMNLPQHISASLQLAEEKLEHEIERSRALQKQCASSCWKSFRVLVFPQDVVLSIQNITQTFDTIPQISQKTLSSSFDNPTTPAPDRNNQSSTAALKTKNSAPAATQNTKNSATSQNTASGNFRASAEEAEAGSGSDCGDGLVMEATENLWPSRLHFVLDRKYVPPISTISAVEQALDDDAGSQVVVIYGEAGTGKSSLAKFLGLRYQGGCSFARPLTSSGALIAIPQAAVMMSPAPPPAAPPSRRSMGSSPFSRPSALLSNSLSIWPSRRSVGTRSTKTTTNTSSSKASLSVPAISIPSFLLPRKSQHLSPGSIQSDSSGDQTNHHSFSLPPRSSKQFTYGIFYLNCGKGADIESKQLELLKVLGFPFPTTKEYDDAQKKPGHSRKNQRALSEQLKTHLDKQKALIILDDVWEAELVEKLMVPGIHVKFLVTSQNAQLWNGAKTIHLDRASLEDARRILANHVGLNLGIVPENLEKVADRLIEATNYNPLALANMAVAIKASQTPHVEEEKQWEEVLSDFTIYLRNEESNNFGFSALDAHLEEEKKNSNNHLYPCRASMMLALEFMPQEALELLIITAACEGPHVPEVVIRVLFQRLNGPGALSKFAKWKSYLAAWSLIEIQDQFRAVAQDAAGHGYGRQHQYHASASSLESLQFLTWSVHGVRKDYIREEKLDNITSIINSLLRDKNSNAPLDKLVAALCVLNGEPELAQRAADKLGISDQGRDYKRNIIEPFVSMLHPGGEEDWKQSSNRLASQVITRFVCAGEMDDEALSHLLEIQQIADTVCMALCVFGDNPTLRSLSVPLDRTVKAVLHLMTENAPISTQRVALDAFIALTHFHTDRQSRNMQVLEGIPDALKCLEKMLEDSKDPVWQCRAAGVLGNLSGYQEMALGKLMGMLSTDRPEKIQRGATSAFATLALGDENKPKMVTFSGALERLVGLLSRDVPEGVQRYAAVAVANLATGNESRVNIAQFPGVLERLVGLLAEDVPESVQHYAAWALANLAVADENQTHMASFPSMLPRLLSRLAPDVPKSVQHQAARALANLTSAYDNLVPMAQFPEALDRFVELLARGVGENIQEHVSRAFASLASADENKIRMAEFPRALPRLVDLLADDVPRSVQQYAAWAVANLAWADENRARIASCPGALEKLVGLLARGVPEGIQQHALRAFANLSWAHENKTKMASCAGALERLVELMRRDDVAESAQQHVVIAFAKLAMADENRVRMAAFPGALDGLVRLLARDVQQNVQRYAAWAFANLAWAAENRERMTAFPRAIDRLVGLLALGVSESVQRQAARALTILDWRGNDDLIVKSPEALIGRGSVKLQQGFYREALADFDIAHKLRPFHEEILWLRAFAQVKAKVNYKAALVDLNKAVEIAPQDYLSWQERGVLKHLMGDFQGALEDLNQAMEISANNYEILKHRGFVKHQLGDNVGAQEDAEKAILFRPMRVDAANYGNTCLGVQPVEFLQYKLK